MKQQYLKYMLNFEKIQYLEVYLLYEYRDLFIDMAGHMVKHGLDWTSKTWTGLISKTWTGLKSPD